MKRWLLRLFGLPGGYGCEPDACFKRVCESCGRPAREAVSADTVSETREEAAAGCVDAWGAHLIEDGRCVRCGEAVSADTPEQDSGTPQSGLVVQHDSLKGEVHDG